MEAPHPQETYSPNRQHWSKGAFKLKGLNSFHVSLWESSWNSVWCLHDNLVRSHNNQVQRYGNRWWTRKNRVLTINHEQKRTSHWDFFTSWLQLSNSLIKRQGMRTIFASKLAYFISHFTVCHQVLFCKNKGGGFFLLFSFLIQNFELVALIKTMYKSCFTYSSSGSASCFPCHSGRTHNLSWLVILALILFCGLNQGLGSLYFFVRIYFFPLVLIAIEMLTVMWLAPSGADTRDASWITGQRA